MEYKLWVARDNNGKLYLYNEKPKYYNDLKVWFSGKMCAKLDNNIFPDLTYEDEPLEVMLTPVMKS